MISINKIIVAFVIVQLAVVLAKPQWPLYDDGLFHSNDNMEDQFYKRASNCGGGCEPEGCYSRRCRSSCNTGERHISMNDNMCSGGTPRCCMCHTGWGGSDCTYDPAK